VSFLRAIQRSWQKNWPELRALARRELPGFVTEREPAPVGAAIPVFCYHIVDRAAFEADLTFLQRNRYVPITADALVAHLRGQRDAPKNAVVLTFDDGPANFYNVAYPLLKQFGMPAVAFIAAAFPEPPPEVEADGHTTPHRTSASHNDGHHRQPARPADGRSNGHRAPATWAQLLTMQRSGLIDVQAHTFQHRYVPRWPEPRPLTGVDPRWVEPRRDPALSLHSDLLLSKTMLEAKLGKTVRHLAFPDYDGTPAAVREAKRLGYQSCWWGLVPGRAANRPGRSPYRIVRLSGEFVRRLPGKDRLPLRRILAQRYGQSIRQRLRSWPEAD
jgi:peptidoglycan/xylan/chitin deacetylase (PgdA/CDA1 family)